MYIAKFKFLLIAFVSCLSAMTAQNKPNILWIVTDDHRSDALECFNKATTGQSESKLGYVSSPNIDKLASEGILFTNAYCNSPACGPSRGSMATGRYPHRQGHYSFEQSHQNPDFVKPTFPQILQEEGYFTAVFGKGDAYIYKWGPGQGFYDAGHYNYKMHFKNGLQKHMIGDFWKAPVFGKVNGKRANLGDKEYVLYPDGELKEYYVKNKYGDITAEEIQTKQEVEEEFDILRSYARQGMKSLIIGGVNPMPAGETVDGKVVQEFKNFLSNENTTYKNSWGENTQGVNPEKPVMFNLGFHLPHTPVLPPKKFRDQFKDITYKVPEFDDEELSKMPPSLVKLHERLSMTAMTAKEKQQAIQDYYAFCAYGDALIGDAVDAFKAYCEKNKQEYLIVFTVGDHGWHLGEQGIEAKFGPWEKSTAGAIIMASSDKKKVPAGLIKKQMVEYVDIAPTILSSGGVDIAEKEFTYLDGINLFEFVNTKKEKRDYILGEIHLVSSPRAYMHSKDFAFSMRTRPGNKADLNKNIKWALNCPVEKAELTLYDLRNDPLERNNVANLPEYKELAQWFREKLGNIVLGDERVECDWSKANTYNISDFAKGANDRKLDIPKNIIPKL
ncbi:sulfatase-like hydrolase/transferase [Saccharicrinis aurantiacus]|uniref:sulfatase-like hydrolase/transferase n=1 Tax=Saccharicrinis aurantiacus TaxID=1849719 RepID=UPI002490C2F2|nr:sulfatase-like hydrolase/transferase [Saccharicrinis aurantiacus]